MLEEMNDVKFLFIWMIERKLILEVELKLEIKFYLVNIKIFFWFVFFINNFIYIL